ncbi:uncharacterized protein Fot_28590 [Forsythia ovata]|uniref:Ubiquitin-like protease family profile domain-containing protein n=1 Tax=Forsythia ovata TaxID=205694 RepID=A0ABD1TPF4_9LAMI
MASTRAKRTTAETSSRRDKKKSKKSTEDDEVLYTPNFVATNEEKNEIYSSGLFHKKQTVNEFGASSSRPAPGEKGKGCCELNEIVMNRLSQIEFKQQELERNQAQIISLHNDLRKEMTNLNRNVQGMFAEFLNQFGKETGGSCYNVLDRQIVLYTGDTSSGRKVEDQNTEGNGVDFDTFNNENVGHGGTDFEVPFEDVIGSRAEDVEVGREVQFDRKGKRVQVDKSNNESGPELEVGGEEPKKYLFEGTFVSKRMFDVLNFCPSFDLGIDDEPNANDIELDDMEFTELDLKMIDECVQMRYLSTSKNEEDVDADDDYILVDDSTPDIPRKRLRKAAAVFKSPYTSNFGSSAKIREIRIGTYALPDELNAVAIEDVVDFEEWYIVGLLKKNKKKKFDDKNEILNPPFDFGVAEVANKKWFYDLRTPGKCLGDTPYAEIIPYLLFHSGFYNAGVSSVVDRSSYDCKDPLDQLTVNILANIPQQQQSGDCGIFVIKYAEYFVHQKIEKMEMTFQLDEARLSLVVQFYKYAKKKLDEGYDTDVERVSDRVK